MRFPGRSEADNLHFTNCKAAAVPLGIAAEEELSDDMIDEGKRNEDGLCTIVSDLDWSD